MADPVVITAAVTGSITSGGQTPHIPLTVEAIVGASLDCWRAGASVIHLHARDAEGTPTQDGRIYAELVERVRAAGCDAVLNLSTGSAGGRSELDDRLQPLDLEPEMATLDCGSMNYGDERVFANPMSFLRRAAARMRDIGCVAEVEAFDPSHIANALRLVGEGLLPSPGVWQLCLGVAGGAPADLPTVSHMLSRLPEGAVWSLLGVGRHQLPVNVLALAWGGHVRTGLEDNVHYRRGELATSSAQLVERVVRLAEEVGRPVASPAQARELLGVRTSITRSP